MLRALLHAFHPTFLQLQVCHKLGKGGIRHQGEITGGVAEVLVEVGGERGEEVLVVDLGTDVAEIIRQLLEAAGVLVDGLVVLMAVVELLLQEDATLELVVGEEAVELDPHGSGIIALSDDGVKQIARDGGEEPADERGVDGSPLGIGGHDA